MSNINFLLVLPQTPPLSSPSCFPRDFPQRTLASHLLHKNNQVGEEDGGEDYDTGDGFDVDAGVDK